MLWERSWRADPRARAVADRHYNRQKIGSPQFVPPGRCLVLLTKATDALWITSWPYAEYVKHDWAGAWTCSAFRNERPRTALDPSGYLSSELIRQACAATRFTFGDPPPQGFVTFVDRTKVRGKRHFGRCYREAGFVAPPCGECSGRGRCMVTCRRVTSYSQCPRCGGTGESRTKTGLTVLTLAPGDIPTAASPLEVPR